MDLAILLHPVRHQVSSDNLGHLDHMDNPDHMGNPDHADHADLAGPTVRILDNIENRKEKLRLLLADYVALAEEIEDWLETVEDPQIQAICRYRFILGKQWNEISRIVCGSLDESTSRSILRRYLNSQSAAAGSSEEPSSGSGKESAAKAGKALR